MKKVTIFFLLTAVILAGLKFMVNKDQPVTKENAVVTAERKFENLAAFVKLYGLVRYYHPSDEAADLDWERFAVYGAGEVKKASDQKELIDKLKKLFDPIAPTMTLYLEDEKPEDKEDEAKEEKDGKVIAWQHYGVNSMKDPDSPYSSKRVLAMLEKGEYQIESGRLFDQYPEVHERVKKQISDGIYCDFPLVLYVDDKGTTIGDEKESRAELKKLKDNLKKLDPAMTSEDEDVRFGGMITTWTILNHFYPYFEVTDSDWQNQLHMSLRDVADDKDRDEYANSLKTLLEKTKDGHASAVFMNDYLKGSLFPFIVDVIGNEVVVTVAADDAPVKAGDIIVEINDQKGMERIEQLKAEIPGSPQYKEYLAAKYFRYGDSADITVKRGDEILEHHVKGNQFSKLDEFNRKESLVELEDDIFYFDMVRGDPKPFNENIDKLSKAKGVIFDLRGSPKSMELALSVLGHLTAEPIKGPVWRVSQSIYPDREKLTYDEGSDVVNPVSPLFSGKAVFLTYAGAMSFPEYILGYIKDNGLAEIVGQPTAGSDGNIQTYPVPGGFTGVFTGMEILNADKTQTHIVGIKPTVPIERTMEGVKMGEDEYIAKALELLKQ